ncbi:MAG: hypothetical protein JRI52_07095 [Deltaproteobacteria bacterium]|nr:hypothetical protein [Deltaproteobacteria bacterium]
MNQSDIENVLHHLNYRWNLEALALWKGDKVPFESHMIYAGYEGFISLDTLASIDRLEGKADKTRLRHALLDHYLQRSLLPHETEMRSWMRGASADIEGRKIYFRDIISWCQKESTFESRQILQKETGPLCKFLKPFALNYWNVLMEILIEDLGFNNYLDYCHEKKGIDYTYYYHFLKGFLESTDDIYFRAMERWAKHEFRLPLKNLTRFDAIYLLGLGQFDTLFPQRDLEKLPLFFKYWDIDMHKLQGLSLELGKEEGKSSQAICFILQIPDEVYILMKPEGGWVDLETLWHELGHGLSAVFTSPHLTLVEREMATSFCLSETYAFLLQSICLSIPFIVDYLGLERSIAERLHYYKVLKELAIFRRYAAKFIVEYEMFLEGDLENGENYSRLMARYTGFYYQPESHLFDLVPEFYCLDYVLAILAEPILERYIKEKIGPDWIYKEETGEILRNWWKQGNRYDIFEFLYKNRLGELDHEMLLKRWKEVLDNGKYRF